MHPTRKTAFLIFVVLLYLFFRGISDRGLLDPLEGVNASIALNMARYLDFFAPRMGKDVLYWGSSLGFWWLSALTLRLVGWVEFSVRLWPALGGLGMAAVSWFIARRAGGERAANYAAVFTGTSLLTYGASQVASPHTLYACCVGMALSGIVYGFRDRRFFLLLHAAAMLAFIVHDPAGAILPWLSFLLYACLTGEESFFLSALLYWPGLLATALLGGGYLGFCFFKNPALLTVMRYTSPALAFGSFSSGLLLLSAGFFPWAGIFPEALSHCVLPRDRKSIQPGEKQNILLAAWATVFLFFGAFSGDALLLAAPLPALTSLCAVYFSDALERKDTASFQRMIAVEILLLLPFIFIELPWIYARSANVLSGTLISVIPWAVFCFFFLFAGWYYAKTRQPRKLMLHLCWIALASLLPLGGVFSLLSDNLAVRDAGLFLRNEMERDDVLVQYFMNYPSFYYYAGQDSLLVHTSATAGTTGESILSETSLSQLWQGTRRVFLTLRRRQSYMPPPQEVYNLYESRDLIVLSNRRNQSQESAPPPAGRLSQP